MGKNEFTWCTLIFEDNDPIVHDRFIVALSLVAKNIYHRAQGERQN